VGLSRLRHVSQDRRPMGAWRSLKRDRGVRSGVCGTLTFFIDSVLRRGSDLETLTA